MNEILLIGGGGHCRSVIDVIDQEGKYKISGIIDKPELVGTEILGYPVIGDDSDISSLSKIYTYALVTVGQIKSPLPRIRLFDLAIRAGFKLPSIISPRAYVSKYASIGEGTIVMHHALVNANAVIGSNCIINSKALIEHDCVIYDNCHVSTNTSINGEVKIEAGCFVGSGAVVKELVTIKQNSFIKAGSMIS